MGVRLVDVNAPVDGLNVNLVLETFSDVIVPVVALVNVKYLVAFVVVSSEMVKPPEPAAHVNADPFQVRDVLAVVGAVINEVAPAPVWKGIWLAVPPAMLVAVVALVAVAAFPPIDKLVAVPVRPVPAPLNDVDVKTPVEGLNCSLVELTNSVVRLPVV